MINESYPKNLDYAELDELYWFIEKKPCSKARENIYLIIMVSRTPRQIVGFEAAFDKSPERIQEIVDKAPKAKFYCTDGYQGYIDIVYSGQHIRNTQNKSDTFTVEGVNADLRHYIPTLARRSRCFARKLDNLKAAVNLFVHAYNKFGLAKYKYKLNYKKADLPFSVIDFL